jgi:hypothetical protein
LVGTWNVDFRQKPLEPPKATDFTKPIATEAFFQVFASADIIPGAELLADYGHTYFEPVIYAD